MTLSSDTFTEVRGQWVSSDAEGLGAQHLQGALALFDLLCYASCNSTLICSGFRLLIPCYTMYSYFYDEKPNFFAA